MNRFKNKGGKRKWQTQIERLFTTKKSLPWKALGRQGIGSPYQQPPPGNLTEMQILEPQPGPTESETLRTGSCNLYMNKSSSDSDVG